MIREMIDTKDDKSLTQGTIFNCALSQAYPNDETLGLIITARCDISNLDKVKVYNFLSVVPFEKWKDKELLPLVKKHVFKNINSNYVSLLSKAGFSESNVDTYGFNKILTVIEDQKKLKDKEIDALKLIKRKIDCILNNSCYRDFIGFFSEESKRIIIEIIENKNSDYFLIDEILGYGPVIVNLREIYELNISTAKNIPNGIELDNGRLYAGLNINVSNKFCSIVGQLKSPFIELLMQRFANNFIRIGVDNHHSALINSIVGI